MLLLITIFLLFLILILFFLQIFFYIKNKKKENIQINVNSNIDENKFLNEINLIGTHNSLSYKIKGIFSPFAKTQNYDLNFQLKKNVRYFDLRFKIINNNLEGYNNFIKLNINHKEVFNTFINFLNQNPNEFIIIVLKNENFTDHEEIFNFLYDYIEKENLKNYFHINKLDWDYIPIIKDLKKKIYILNFIKKNNNDVYCLPWNDNQTFKHGSINISDCYKISNYDKINLYKDFENKKNDKDLNIFYFSSEYSFNFIFGIFFYNKNLKKKIDFIILKKNLKNKNLIYVFDFIDIHENINMYIYN